MGKKVLRADFEVGRVEAQEAVVVDAAAVVQLAATAEAALGGLELAEVAVWVAEVAAWVADGEERVVSALVDRVAQVAVPVGKSHIHTAWGN